MAGFKTFVDLDILTAAEVNDFLMTQAVMVFADAAARTTALPTPTEGMVTYLEDTDNLEVFTGASFVLVNDNTAAILKAIIDAKGDLIVGTAADTPARLAVGTNEHRLVADSGETAGLKYVADTTNFAIAAKGDLLAGTAADTVAALSVGSNGQVLTADSSTATGLAWAAAAVGGGKVLQVVAATHATEVLTTSTSFSDTNLTATITPSAETSKVLVFVSQPISAFASAVTVSAVGLRLLRASTEIFAPYAATFETLNVSGHTISPLGGGSILAGIAYLDSPSTTSATAYKTQIRAGSASVSARSSGGGAAASIVLLEIGV